MRIATKFFKSLCLGVAVLSSLSINDAEAARLKDIASIQVDIDTYRHAQNTKKILKKQNERLMEYMTNVILTTGQETIRMGKHLFKVKHKSYVTNILDENKVPDSYKEKETSWKIDKTAIGKAIRSGEKIPGAEVIENRKTTID